MNRKPVVASRYHLWAVAAAIAATCLFTLSALPAAAQSQTDLARAYRTIASKTFVDLTHSFGPDTLRGVFLKMTEHVGTMPARGKGLRYRVLQFGN